MRSVAGFRRCAAFSGPRMVQPYRRTKGERRMRHRSWRLGVAALAMVLVGAAALHASTTSKRVAPLSSSAAAGEGDMPAALGRHLEQLQESIPGKGGEPGGSGPSTAGLQDFFELAYPGKDVSLAKIKRARRAVAKARTRMRTQSHGPGHGHFSRWNMVGPDTAIYQFTPLRNARSYVPNEYAAGGRTTDLAIDPHCGQLGNRCRMWITPAGGGVWRTDDALAPHPHWEYLSRSFGINSIGSITIDPNDSSTNTLWVGTG